MTGLEITLFILGTAFIIISFFIVENTDRSPKAAATSALDADSFEQLRSDIIRQTNKEADIILHETEDKLESVSNDKIIAVGEYSDQILEKIGSNHKEVVFLYQMLNEKEEELKSTATQMDNIRIECEKLMKEVKELKEKQAATATEKRASVPERRNSQPAEHAIKQSYSDGQSTLPDGDQLSGNSEPIQEMKNAVTKTSASRTRSTSAATASRQANKAPAKRTPVRSSGTATSQMSFDNLDTGSLSRNDEIIALHKSGKSVMEISKLLGMGQGEVKLIIDLYC